MSNSPTTETMIAPSTAAGRCLKLAPVLDQLGLDPVVIGVGRVVLGSGPDADILLPVEGVAPRHAEIEFNGRRARLKVISPLTWVNDGAVREATLADGDLLTLGPVEIRVCSIPVPGPPPAPAANESSSEPDLTRDTATLHPIEEAESIETSTDSLLNEAAAAEHLRRDLARLEREAEWYRRHTTRNPRLRRDEGDQPQPSSTESACDGGHRDGELEQRLVDLVRQQAGASRQGEVMDDDFVAAVSQYGEPEDRSSPSDSEREPLSEERQAPGASVAELRPERSDVDTQKTQLDSLREELEVRERAVQQREQCAIDQEQEFNNAVAALDLDRAAVGQERDALRCESEQLRTSLASVEAELSERESRLREAVARVEQTQAELESRERELPRAVAEFESVAAEREQAIAQREQELADRVAELKSHRDRFADRDVEIATAFARVDSDRSALESLQNRLARSQEQLRRTEVELAGDRERLQSQLAALEQKQIKAADEWRKLSSEREQLDIESAEFRRQREQLGTREQACQKQEQQLRTREEDVAAAQQVADRRTVELEEQATAQNERAARLDRRRKELEATTAETERLHQVEEQRLAAEREQIETERAHLATERERISTLEAELAAHTAQVESAAAAANAETERQLKEERVRFEEASETIRQLEARIEELQHDNSAGPDSQEDRGESDSDLTDWQTRLEQRQAQLDEEQAHLEAQEQRLLEREEAITERLPQLDEEARRETGEQAARAKELESALAVLTEERDTLRAEVEDLRLALTDLRQQGETTGVSDSERAAFEEERRLLAQDAADLQQLREEYVASEQELRNEAERLEAERRELEQARVAIDEERAAIETARESLSTPETHPEIFEQPNSDGDSTTAEGDWDHPSDAHDGERFQQFGPSENRVETLVEVAPEGVATSKEAAIFDVSNEGSVSEQALQQELDQSIFLTGEVTPERNEPGQPDPEQDVGEPHLEFADSGEPACDDRNEETRDDGDATALDATDAVDGAPTQDDGGAIRSQLAELFGLSTEELTETEHRHEHDQADDSPVGENDIDHARSAEANREIPPADEHPPATAQAPKNQPPESPLPTEEAPDSVAAYMEQLLSRSQTASAAEPSEEEAPTPVIDDPPPADPPAADDVAPAAEKEAEPDAEKPARSGRRLDENDIAKMRANIDSMREIANQSARSAVAKHYSQKLAMTYQVKLILTIVGGVITAVLFSAELWTDISYRVQAFCTLAVTLISGIELARTKLQMHHVNTIVNSGRDREDGDEQSTPADTEPPSIDPETRSLDGPQSGP